MEKLSHMEIDEYKDDDDDYDSDSDSDTLTDTTLKILSDLDISDDDW